MRIIQTPQLEIRSVHDDPTSRLLRVSYDLVTAGPEEEQLSTQVIEERVVVHAIDREDAALPPRAAPLLERQATYTAAPGTVHRTIEATVNRNQLDVEPDWWSTDLDGQVRGIAEWIDHIIGDIQVSIDGQVIDQATTTVVSGSWGILGAD